MASRGLDASNPGVRTTRLRRTRHVIRLVTWPRPPLPAPTSVAIAIRPSSRARDNPNKPVICVGIKRKYFCKGGLDSPNQLERTSEFRFYVQVVLTSPRCLRGEAEIRCKQISGEGQATAPNTSSAFAGSAPHPYPRRASFARLGDVKNGEKECWTRAI